MLSYFVPRVCEIWFEANIGFLGGIETWRHIQLYQLSGKFCWSLADVRESLEARGLLQWTFENDVMSFFFKLGQDWGNVSLTFPRLPFFYYVCEDKTVKKWAIMFLNYPLKVTYFHATQVKLEMTEHRHLFFKWIGKKWKVLLFIYNAIDAYILANQK